MYHYDRELEKRLSALERPDNQGSGLDAVSIAWLVGGCVLFPILILAWGW